MAADSRSEPRQFSSVHRPVQVQRLEVVTAVVDHNYSRVELCIDGTEFEFSGPDAQVVGAHLNTAGGGDMYAKTGAEHTIRRAYRALSSGNPAAGISVREVTEALEILRAAVESYG
jgi:hypothetical protein